MQEYLKDLGIENLEQFKELLVENDFEDTIVFENYDYFTAIVGISSSGSVIYDYDLMAEYLVSTGDFDDLTEAYDFIDYNTIRALPYANDGVKPTILYHTI